ncbi:MAG: DUF4221 family protein [Saprospiraceae bacterium]|nr:DUF4221 family protein [Saprospiraceae bacterium]
MKVSISNLLFFVLCFCFIQCNVDDTAKSCEDTHAIVTIDKTYPAVHIDLDLDKKPYDFRVYDVFDNNERTVLSYYTDEEHTIQMVDLNESIFLPSIPLAKEGTNKVESVNDIIVHNKDSIFVFSGELQQIYLINGQGAVIKKIDLAKILENEKLPTYVVSNSPESKIIYWSDKKLLIFQVTYELSDSYYTPELYKHPFIGLYSLENEKLEKIGRYPESYQENETAFEDYYPIATDFKDKIVTCYGVSHHVGATNLSNQSTEFYCAKSNFLGTSFNLLQYDAPFPKRNEFYRTSGFYTKILYDKYNNCYYRLVKHDQNNKDENDKLSQYLQSKWSILVLDNQLNVVKEAIFDDKLYDFDIIAVTRNGLLISKENPFSSSNQEEVLSFDLIKI